ncbi:MAG: carbohydrate ABC transporter permease [Rhizobiales bacterium]|nr:carbohydrate ABC transporter permease [Hyphomicrobiales bacterium]
MSAPEKRGWLPRILIFLGAIFIVIYSTAPFIWMLIASITPEHVATDDAVWLSTRKVEFFPSEPSLVNYFTLFDNVPFALYFRNSAIIATGTMCLSLFAASLGAYAFSRFRFAGRRPLLVAMLMAYLVPSVVLLVPLLVIFKNFGLINTHLGMIFAESSIAAPFVLLLMINFFSPLPRELEEAAQVDGCSRLSALFYIVLPLALPGLVAGGLIAFILSWNNFLFAFLFTSTDSVKTLPVLMRLFALGEPAVWGVSTAGAVVSTLPVALLFLAFQRMMISGLAAGAVKG